MSSTSASSSSSPVTDDGRLGVEEGLAEGVAAGELAENNVIITYYLLNY